MSANISVGEVRRLVGADALALVVCLWDHELDGEDVRVVPVRIDGVFAAIATDRDVILPWMENTTGHALIASCWNARCLSRLDLADLVGIVSPGALEAVRAIEMSGIVPEIAERFREWCGVPVLQDDDPRLEAQRTELREWDDVQTRLVQFRGAQRHALDATKVRGGSMKRGHAVQGAPLIPEVHITTPRVVRVPARLCIQAA